MAKNELSGLKAWLPFKKTPVTKLEKLFNNWEAERFWYIPSSMLIYKPIHITNNDVGQLIKYTGNPPEYK
jgi:hypothetical protein